MKAVRIHAFGDSGQLRIEELPQPTPSADEVLVEVRRAGVNPVDWKLRQGMLARAMAPFPLTLGQDLAGEVTQVGTGASRDFHSGDRVFGFANGAYAEFALCGAGDIVPLPKDVTFEIAAALPTPGLTAFQLLHGVINLQPGQTLLIHGAAGAVGTMAVQMARSLGLRVVATDLPNELGYLRKLGAAQVLDVQSAPFESVVGQVDAAIALVDGDLIRRTLPIIRRCGVIASTVGHLDHATAERLGVRAVEFVMQRSAKDLSQLAQLADQGTLRPRIAAVLPLDQARRAQDLSQRGEAHGKILLRAA